MSLLPYLIDLHRPSRLPDQQLTAMALPPEALLTLMTPSCNYLNPWNKDHILNAWTQQQLLTSILRDAASTIKSDREKFQINLDVQHFRPEEISVKVANGFVIVEGRHEEKKDEHGFVSRQFTRRYALPEGCNAEAIQSSLSSDGVLSVVAPLETPEGNGRVVPIVRTGPIKTEGGRAEVGNGEPESTAVTNGQ